MAGSPLTSAERGVASRARDAGRIWPGATLLDRYVAGELIGALAFGVAVFGLLLVANQFFYLARVVIEYNFPSSQLLPLMVYKLPVLLSFSLPMAMLLATILSFGRLSEGREIEAMQTSGIGLHRIALPAVVLAAAVSVAAFAVNETIVPASEIRYREAWGRFAGQPVNWGQRWNVLFRDRAADGSEVVVTAQVLDLEEGTLRNVVVQQHVSERLSRIIEAEHARWDRDGWVFERGRLIVVQDGAVMSDFQTMRLRLERSPREVAPPIRTPAEMSTAEIRREIARRERDGQPTRGLHVDLHGKLALPAASVAFVVLGIPLALLPHRAGRRGIGFGLTVVALLGYYALMTGSTVMGQAGQLPSIVAAWLPNAVTAGVGVWLIRRRR
ncbi:MAG: LptF/LptG family permease [Armatimonadota bacterium]|nr:LptF/LptG family permease [Armatimonadota bacterium]MDR5697523.1 LptF/LptG family permease [Armatimonadota bacterium]